MLSAILIRKLNSSLNSSRIISTLSPGSRGEAYKNMASDGLVFTVNYDWKSKSNKRSRKRVRILAQNPQSAVEEKLRSIVQVGDEGWVEQTHLKDLGKQVLKVANFNDQTDSYFKPTNYQGQHLQLVCPEMDLTRKYILFNHYHVTDEIIAFDSFLAISPYSSELLHSMALETDTDEANHSLNLPPKGASNIALLRDFVDREIVISKGEELKEERQLADELRSSKGEILKYTNPHHKYVLCIDPGKSLAVRSLTKKGRINTRKKMFSIRGGRGNKKIHWGSYQ